MRINCPVCDTAYDVPDRMLKAGRAVRCKRCATTWSPPPPPSPPLPEGDQATIARAGARLAEAEAVAQPASPPLTASASMESPPEPMPLDMERPAEPARMPGEIPAIDRLRATAPRSRAGVVTWLGWGVSVAVLGAVGYGAVARREDVLRLWPATARVYAPLGLADPPPASLPPPSVAKVP